MYSTNIWPESEVRGSGSYIYGIHHNSHGSYDIYYADIILECRADNVTIKTTYNNILYLFIDLSTSFASALANLKKTKVSYVIDEFTF